MLILLWNKCNFFPIPALYHLHSNINQTRTMNHYPRINIWGSYWNCNLQRYKNACTFPNRMKVFTVISPYIFSYKMIGRRKRRGRQGSLQTLPWFLWAYRSSHSLDHGKVAHLRTLFICTEQHKVWILNKEN